jgi:hypothetical protein
MKYRVVEQHGEFSIEELTTVEYHNFWSSFLPKLFKPSKSEKWVPKFYHGLGHITMFKSFQEACDCLSCSLPKYHDVPENIFPSGKETNDSSECEKCSYVIYRGNTFKDTWCDDCKNRRNKTRES